MTASPKPSAFGPTVPAQDVDYGVIAAQVKAINPRLISKDQHDDVITLIEYMRDQAVKIHERNEEILDEIKARELAVSRRERDVETKARAVKAAINSQSVGARLRSYFKR